MSAFSDILQWEPAVRFVALPSHTQFSVGLIFILALYFHARFNPKTFAYAPTILTTTGIFFTFLGIAWRLSDFDTNNVQASVPALLGGLKTAFWASVCGVGWALTVKFRHFFWGVREEQGLKKSDEEVTAHDVARLLSGIQHALVGQDEATLISQMKLS